MLRATHIRYPLHFIRPAGTSRGVLHSKPCWFLLIGDGEGKTGIGEVSHIPGLSPEHPETQEMELNRICSLIDRGEFDPETDVGELPGIRFAYETAMTDLGSGGSRVLWPSEFTAGKRGIRVNGLIWMGSREEMAARAREKLESGFRVLKMKVGALQWKEELEIIGWLRSMYGRDDLEIRLDANGAWDPDEALLKLDSLSRYSIHSIEQPIGTGQTEPMARLCERSPIPVALDEELIGISGRSERSSMLTYVRPAYIILKPGLLGGFSQAEEWIELAREAGAGWWITSALESNIGLNAIAQWTYRLGVTLPQGLGTGLLYRNNIPSPLCIRGDSLWHGKEGGWGIQHIEKKRL